MVLVRKSAFGGDIRDAAALAGPVALGMVPLGIAFGLVLTQLGLVWWWAPVFSSVVYAGSLEFLLAALVSAAAPLAQIAATTLVVNSRHLFYAISFPIDRVHGLPRKAYAMYALTDEAYALTALPQVRRWPGRRIVLLQILLQLGWVGGATLGAVAGSFLPLGAVQGFEFALTALFLVLALESYSANPRTFTVLLALTIGIGSALFIPQHMLLVAYTALVAGLVGAFHWDKKRTHAN